MCMHFHSAVSSLVRVQFFAKKDCLTFFFRMISYLVTWCFKPSQEQRIISGLMETFIKSYIVERTNEAEIRPEEQSEKAESCRENLWNELQLKGHKDRNRHKNTVKRSGQAGFVYKPQHPRHVKVSPGDFQNGSVSLYACSVTMTPPKVMTAVLIWSSTGFLSVFSWSTLGLTHLTYVKQPQSILSEETDLKAHLYSHL